MSFSISPVSQTRFHSVHTDPNWSVGRRRTLGAVVSGRRGGCSGAGSSGRPLQSGAERGRPISPAAWLTAAGRRRLLSAGPVYSAPVQAACPSACLLSVLSALSVWREKSAAADIPVCRLGCLSCLLVVWLSVAASACLVRRCDQTGRRSCQVCWTFLQGCVPPAGPRLLRSSLAVSVWRLAVIPRR